MNLNLSQSPKFNIAPQKKRPYQKERVVLEKSHDFSGVSCETSPGGGGECNMFLPNFLLVFLSLQARDATSAGE